MPVDLTDEERQLLVNLLTIEIEASKFPLSPRIEQLKRIRAKLRGEPAPVGTPEPSSRRKRER
jgi:hypothetical protein